MDHLPLPHDPAIGSLTIPFLCTDEYDNGAFSSYPGRHGWNVQPNSWPIPLLQYNKHVVDTSEIGAFLQTWLYFGLLSDTLGTSVNADSFAALDQESSVRRFSSSSLEDMIRTWSMKLMSMEAKEFLNLIDGDGYDTEIDDDDALDFWIRERQDALNMADDFWQRIAEAFEDETDDTDETINLILLSIAALGDCLGQAIIDIAHVHGINIADRQVIWLLPEKTCSPILKKMRNWCPNRINGLITAQYRTAGVLWYYANLRPPSVYDNHILCTAQRCRSLHVERHRYHVKHVREDCQCALIGPPANDLAEIVWAGRVASFTLEGIAGNTSVTVHASPGTESYIAISHIWADGHGNLETNSLPLCFLEDLQTNINTVGLPQPRRGHTPIWMDTICLPRYPVELRTQAIADLSKVFSKAAGILVLDSYLQSISCAGLDQIEILTRVSLSGWTSRLWTFSEGQLARQIWVRFKDKIVDLLELILDLENKLKARKDDLRFLGSDYELSSLRYAAIVLIGRKNQGQEHPLPLDLYEMKSALMSRHTSWKSDEALCLGAVLELDLEKIAKVEDHKKMLAFWQQIEFVPSALVFTHCSSRLEDDGFRWAPSTMLGGTDVHLATIGLQHSASYSTPTEHGLEITAHALMWNMSASNPMDQYRGNLLDICQQKGSEVMLKNQDGGWYSCVVKEQWHQSPIESESILPEPVILFLDYWQDLEPQELDTIRDLEEGLFEDSYEPMRGVFATVRSKSGSQLARVHMLLEVRELTKKERKLFEELAALATIFAARGPGKVSLKLNDASEISRVQTWLLQYLSSAALQTILEDVEPNTRLNTGMDERLEMCVQHIHRFCLLGDWYKVQISEDWTTWTVD